MNGVLAQRRLLELVERQTILLSDADNERGERDLLANRQIIDVAIEDLKVDLDVALGRDEYRLEGLRQNEHVIVALHE